MVFQNGPLRFNLHHYGEACEFILGRCLRASDNVMKFCVHGGELNKSLAASIMGLTTDALSKKMDERKRERLRAEAAAAEEEEDEGVKEDEEKKAAGEGEGAGAGVGEEEEKK